MARPKLPEPVTVRTPTPTTEDPETGNPTSAVTETRCRARISQAPVANVGTQQEIQGVQDTTVSFWTVLVDAWVPMTSRSEVIDSRGRVFRIAGEVADRPNHRPVFRAAAARLISDMQGA